MNIFNINFNKYRKSNVRAAFRKFRLESILWGLWQFRGKLDYIQKAYTTTIAIEFSEPGPYDDRIEHLPEPFIMELVHLATNFCLEHDKTDPETLRQNNKIFYSIFNLIANQFSFSSSYSSDFARSLLLFDIIPKEIQGNGVEYNLPEVFEKDNGYSIEEYLQVCFIAYAAIEANGKFTDDYFEKAATVMNSPKFETVNKILLKIAVSARHYRRERKKLNSSESFKLQPILMYPLIRPWSDIPIKAKGKRYLSPLPNLIAHKANIGIYHYFLTKLKTKFTTFFGKQIFERYVEKTLIHCCLNSQLKNENVIKSDYKIPNGVKMPDFLVIHGDKGIIVECKAAALPLKVYTTGNKEDYASTVKKIYTGISQVSSFKEYASQNFYTVLAIG